MKKAFFIIAILFVFVTCKQKDQNQPPKIVYPEYQLKSIDSQIVIFINIYRAENKKPILKINRLACNVAYSHSDYMAKNKVYNHFYFMDRANAFPDWYCGENVAYNFVTAQSNFSAWKNSPDHNTNMLDDRFTEVGISTEYDEKGKSYVTCFFIGILKKHKT